MNEANTTSTNKNVNRLVTKLLVVVVAMFGFGFLLVPLYDVFCEVTGINGKIDGTAYKEAETEIDTKRIVKVEFVATNNDKMSWLFKPNTSMLEVHPGATMATTFYTKNPSTYNMTAQAIPSVMPSRAAPYFHKTECFCFSQQSLKAGEEVEMALRFIVDKDLPKDIQTITLSYTLFDVTEKLASTE